MHLLLDIALFLLLGYYSADRSFFFSNVSCLLVLEQRASFLHFPDILIILNIPVKRLSPHLDRIVCPLLKLSLRHFLFEVAERIEGFFLCARRARLWKPSLRHPAACALYALWYTLQIGSVFSLSLNLLRCPRSRQRFMQQLCIAASVRRFGCCLNAFCIYPAAP